jgi:hypothetical protein
VPVLCLKALHGETLAISSVTVPAITAALLPHARHSRLELEAETRGFGTQPSTAPLRAAASPPPPHSIFDLMLCSGSAGSIDTDNNTVAAASSPLAAASPPPHSSIASAFASQPSPPPLPDARLPTEPGRALSACLLLQSAARRVLARYVRTWLVAQRAGSEMDSFLSDAATHQRLWVAECFVDLRLEAACLAIQTVARCFLARLPSVQGSPTPACAEMDAFLADASLRVMSEPKPVGVASVEMPAAKPVGELITTTAAKPVGVLTASIAKPLGTLVDKVPKPLGVTLTVAKPVGELIVATAEPVGVPLTMTVKPVGALVTVVPKPIGVALTPNHQTQTQSQQYMHVCTYSQLQPAVFVLGELDACLCIQSAAQRVIARHVCAQHGLPHATEPGAGLLTIGSGGCGAATAGLASAVASNARRGYVVSMVQSASAEMDSFLMDTAACVQLCSIQPNSQHSPPASSLPVDSQLIREQLARAADCQPQAVEQLKAHRTTRENFSSPRGLSSLLPSLLFTFETPGGSGETLAEAAETPAALSESCAKATAQLDSQQSSFVFEPRAASASSRGSSLPPSAPAPSLGSGPPLAPPPSAPSSGLPPAAPSLTPCAPLSCQAQPTLQQLSAQHAEMDIVAPFDSARLSSYQQQQLEHEAVIECFLAQLSSELQLSLSHLACYQSVEPEPVSQKSADMQLLSLQCYNSTQLQLQQCSVLLVAPPTASQSPLAACYTPASSMSIALGLAARSGANRSMCMANWRPCK